MTLKMGWTVGVECHEGRGSIFVVFFFFFKQKTAYEMCGRDWSSDVCSSDLADYVGEFVSGEEPLRSIDWCFLSIS